MPTASNMAQLRAMLQREVSSAMNELQSKVKSDMEKELKEFYSQGSPSIYHRTHSLERASRVSSISGGGNTISFEAYLEPPNYVTPNVLFTNRGFQSYYSGAQVLSAAESHSSRILGKGGFWSRTLKDIKIDIATIMHKHFS